MAMDPMHPRGLTLISLFVACFGLTAAMEHGGAQRPGAPQGNRLAGAWDMISYEGPASVGRSSGMLLMVDDGGAGKSAPAADGTGRFSMIYTMDETEGRRSGRAHGGRYRVNGNRLVFDVEHSMEYVSGKPSMAAAASQAIPIFTIDDQGNLTLRFSDGGVQRFRRVQAAGAQ